MAKKIVFLIFFVSLTAHSLQALPPKNYHLIWSDEFNKSQVDTTVWTFDTGDNGWGNNELQYYTQQGNAEVKNGLLTITARKTESGYTSARMITRTKRIFTYGYIEIRAKLPKGKGTWPALWLLGQNMTQAGWPACGELDIMEHAAVSRNAATEGMILLKNDDNTLPFKSVKRVALFGKTSYSFIAGGTGSGEVNYEKAISIKDGFVNAGYKVLPQLENVYTNFIDTVLSHSKEENKKQVVDFHASKFAIEGLSDSLRNEVKPFGIDVILIEPGGIATEWSSIAFDNLNKSSEQSAYKEAAIKFSTAFKKTTRKHSDPAIIARLILHAIEAKHPKARYAAGYMALEPYKTEAGPRITSTRSIFSAK